MWELEFTEDDWKLFRARLPIWQERYMAELLEKYRKILSSEDPASTKFWELEKSIREDQKRTGVLVRRISRSNMQSLMMALISEKAITGDDLDGFSQNLRESMFSYSDRIASGTE